MKRKVFLTVVAILATQMSFSRSLSATDYPYPAVDQSDIDNRGLPCYMQTEEGSTLDLSHVCKQPDPVQDETAPTETFSESDGSANFFRDRPYSPDPYSADEPPQEVRF